MSEVKTPEKTPSYASPAENKLDSTASAGKSGPKPSGNLDLQTGEILQDISPVATIQQDNLKKMTEAVQTASNGLKSILTEQQKSLQLSLEGLQKSLTGSRTQAGIENSPVPSLNIPIENLTRTLANLNSAATTLTMSMTGSIDSLEDSINKTEAAIKEVEQKFSSLT
ncbi:MAG: hypothetical protein NXI13_08930 [Proteobacteria bacterium]|nr:hypothetical protein [Pseudomonadota bacterium]